jgi:acyl carrier protein
MPPTFETTRDLIVQATGLAADAVTPNTRLCDLGFDSLDRVELALAIEDRLGIEAPDSALDQVDLARGTVQNLHNVITTLARAQAA